MVKENFKTNQNRSALLLNASYEAMKVISWQKAIVLWLSDKVDVIEFHNIYIHSAKARFPIPSVIKLRTYISSVAFRRVRFSKQNVYLRDGYICQYCAKRCSNKELTIDHVIPISKQGPENWNNVVTACRHCNQRKGNRTPATAGMPLLKEPEAPHWITLVELELQNDMTVPLLWQNYLNHKAG